MRNTLKKLSAVLLACGIIFTGCGAKKDVNTGQVPSDYNYNINMKTEEAGVPAPENSPAAFSRNAEVAGDQSFASAKIAPPDTIIYPPYKPGDINSDDRKLTKNGFIEISVDDIGDYESVITNIALKSGGYVYNVNQNETSRRRNLNITIKVKSSEFDTVMNSLKELGTVDNVSYSVDDVTMEYAETESLIATLKVKEERLNAILAKATKIEDILAIENQLQSTRQELSSASSRMSILKNQTDYSTINVTVHDAKEIDQKPPQGLFERFRDNMMEGLQYWGRFFTDLISAVIFALPAIIGILALAFIIRLFRKRRKNTGAAVKDVVQEEDKIREEEEWKNSIRNNKE